MTAKGLSRALACVLSLACVLGTSGCSSSTADKSATNDAVIASGVRNQLVKDSELSGYPIMIDVVQGNVTLQGQVARSDQRDNAEKLARGVDGVETVSNRIFVSSDQTKSPEAPPPTQPE
jgi:osmotically-inducible protein OsmY